VRILRWGQEAFLILIRKKRRERLSLKRAAKSEVEELKRERPAGLPVPLAAQKNWLE
jgi:hypothetical protein